MNRHITWFLFAGILAAIILCIGISGLALTARAYDQRYDRRIYPGVSVYGVDLGGMTVDEAVVSLSAALPDPAALTLTLHDGEHVWNRSWADLEIQINLPATARLAYQVGREGSTQQQRGDQLQALLAGWPLPPIIVLPDPDQAAAALEALAPEMFVSPINASLIIQPTGIIIPVPAQAGRALNVEATVAALPHAISISNEGLVMTLLTRQVEPVIGNPGEVHAQAEALLGHPFVIAAEDTLTSFSTTWALGAETVAGWLTVQESEDGTRLILSAQEEPIRTTLENLDSQLSDEISLDVEKTIPTVQAALEAGMSQATATLTHPPRTYTVQPGDTLMSIGRAHGFPVWWLTEANPDIDPETLRPGQQIVIPSIDVLFPFPLITGRRIVIDISDQHLYAYEDDGLIYDFLCATGIESSPTIPGTFQVLSKEENAYASSWDLWMPHFMGIYHSGPDFTNGIHALPTLSNGTRLWEGYLGSPVSYGCIVIGLDEATKLYGWTELGTLVIIQD